MSIPADIQEQIAAIRANNTSGAAELAKAAAHVFIALSDAGYDTPADLQTAVEDTAGALVAAQPAMAPMVTLANDALLQIEQHDSLAPMQTALRRAAQTFLETLSESTPAIAAALHPRIPTGATILTYSYSSTVLTSLRHAHDAGAAFDVICTESRPANEGITLARKLADAGISIRLIIDAAMFSFLDQVDLVLVGADSVAAQGVTNKIGTSALAQAAHAAGIEVYALCSTAKFLPAGVAPHAPERKPARELLDDPPDTITPVNYYFDLEPAPLHLFAGVVTEDGILAPADVEQRISQRTLHSKLRRS